MQVLLKIGQRLRAAAGPSLLSLLLLCGAFTPLEVHDSRVRVVVIDAGHGGHDPGALGYSRTTKEARVALGIALELGEMIKKEMPGVKVIYTRSDNTFIELHKRAAIANEAGADLFISVHCNSGPSAAYGTEVYAMGLHKEEGNLDVAKRENQVILMEDDHEENYGGYNPNSPIGHIIMANYQSAYLQNSLRFASQVDKRLVSTAGRRSRGVKQAGFLVLWKTTMPSVLVETGFISNKNEEAFLSTESGQTKVARSIFEALKVYKQEMEQF